MAPKELDVLGLGCTAVDDLLYVPRYPGPDAKQPLAKHERHCGGLTATALVAASRLGARTGYAGKLGGDPDSAFVLDTLEREGVNTEHAVRSRNARPVHSFIIVEERSHSRTILYRTAGAEGAADRSPARAVIESARVLLVDRWGVKGMIRAARIARKAGVPVVGDLETFDVPRFERLLALVDHLIVPDQFVRRYLRVRSPAEGARKLWRKDRAVVVVTCGRNGCWFVDRSGTKPRHLPAFKVEPVDTTGCGDVFHGAYAAALAKGLKLEERLSFASAAAALKATRTGGQNGAPRLPELRRFLASVST